MSMLRGTGVALYHATLSTASAIPVAVYGSFSAPKQDELVVSRGTVLQLLRKSPRPDLQLVCSTSAFGQVRSLAAFRLPGAPTDYVVVGSDSGRVVILEFSSKRRGFVKVHQETFGRSGCRRIVPGQYVACDPAGRAVMLAAVEKQKFVYVLNRDAASKLTISSPLEAHKSRHVTYALAALDNGFGNPLFAAIELDYTDADEDPSGEAAQDTQKHVAIYELDLGLNHVTRRWSEPTEFGANMLIAVPGDSLKVKAEDLPGPGGVLVCAENFVFYVNEGAEALSCLIPRRASLPGDRGILLVAAATHKMRNQFVVLAQSEYGDLYKITLVYDAASGAGVTELRVRYFDTIPPATTLAIFKTGFLFAASDAGDHGLYEFLGLGDDDGDAGEASSARLLETEEGFAPVFFEPGPLRNLALVDTLPSLAPLVDMKVANLLGEEVPQLYAACGRGTRSTLRVLRAGIAILPIAVTELPARPTAVWTVRKGQEEEFDDLIVISFADDNATLVLRVGETVQEVNDSGLEGKTATLGMQLLSNNSVLQVHSGGLRHVYPDRRINKWAPPGRRTITACALNTQQVVIALSNSELIYFELNAAGQLLEVEKKDVAGDVCCLAIAPLSEGRSRSSFVVVGTDDNTARVLSLEPGSVMQTKATQTVSSTPHSALLLEADVSAAGDAPAARALFLHLGLVNGVLIRTEVDPISGRLSDQRTRFLGTRPPTLLPLTIDGAAAVAALSSRPWLGHLSHGKFVLEPLAYDALDYVAPFASEKVPEGIVAIARGAAVATGTLRVLVAERVGETFTARSLRLAYTPRRIITDEASGTILVAEADAGVLPYSERTDLQESALSLGLPSPFLATGELVPDLAEREERFGTPRGDDTQWGSCLRIVDGRGAEPRTASVHHLDNNEAALCMCLVPFASKHGAAFLAVGTAKGLKFFPREAEEGYVRIYYFGQDGRSLHLLHSTPLGGLVPTALCPFQGRLLVGAGRSIRLMDCGKRRMLRKCEFSGFPGFVTSIHAMGNRVYVGDALESFHFLRYKTRENSFYIFADDATPRYLTSALLVDYDTVAGGDKFGNFGVLRMPAAKSAQVEDDPTGGKFAASGGILNSAPHKAEPICNFHVGDLVRSMQLCALQQGGQEMILYGTISGAIGVMLPFTNNTDLDFFTQLEMHLRQLAPSLVGRDHLAFRSAFFPVRDVIDGDLCEQFATLTYEKQKSIAEETDRATGEVLKKLEDMRYKIL